VVKKLYSPVTRRHFLAGTAAGTAGLSLAAGPWRFARAAGTVQLRLLETTDVHVHVFPYDYYRDREDQTVGLANTASIIDALRAESPNTLLVDNGDFLQGNPMGDYMAYQRGLAEGDVHPIVKAMNAVGFDVATIGNHEFNYGLDFLMTAVAGADFPVVLANVHKGTARASVEQDDFLVPPWTMLERAVIDGTGAEHTIRIGVIGFTPPQIMTWDRAHLEGNVGVRGIVPTAAALVPQIREAGADIVVALSHSGVSTEAEAAEMENASFYLSQVPGIDAILTGHHHRVFPGPDYADLPGIDAERGLLGGVPAVMGGFWGSHLGVIDLMLERDGGSWRVVDAVSEARPIYRRQEREVIPLVEASPAILAAVRAEHEATLDYVRAAVGETSAPINSYFALVQDDPSVQIVSNAQRWYIERMMQGTEHEGLTVLSAAAPFKAGGRGGPDYYTDVPAGPIAIKNVADLYLYPNTIRAVRITGATVKEWLERSAGQFNQLASTDAPQQLVDTDFPSYNFDVIDGVTYRIDLTQPARYDVEGNLVNPDAERIVDLAVDGRPIDPAEAFIVATNNYRAGGGGNFPGIGPEVIVFVGPDTNRDIIVRYIVEQGIINPSADGNWSFVPVPGATDVRFRTSPAAITYLETVPGAAPEGETDEGFAVFRLPMAG
jgi:2',3'-cyclic-nucleotide 2'-phosphodiesterase/3'-nucleotidase